MASWHYILNNNLSSYKGVHTHIWNYQVKKMEQKTHLHIRLKLIMLIVFQERKEAKWMKEKNANKQ